MYLLLQLINVVVIAVTLYAIFSKRVLDIDSRLRITPSKSIINICEVTSIVFIIDNLPEIHPSDLSPMFIIIYRVEYYQLLTNHEND